MLVEKNNFHWLSELLLERGIQYVGIINKQGRLETNISKNNVDLPEKKREILYMQQRLQDSMYSDFDEDFGRVNYTMTERKNLKMLTIPIFPYLVFVIINKDADHDILIPKIITTVRRSSDISSYKYEIIGEKYDTLQQRLEFS